MGAQSDTGSLAEDDPLASLWTPGGFVNPERDRQILPEVRPGDSKELFDYTIQRLRDELNRVKRGEDF
jgi:ribonuclease HIII